MTDSRHIATRWPATPGTIRVACLVRRLCETRSLLVDDTDVMVGQPRSMASPNIAGSSSSDIQWCRPARGPLQQLRLGSR